MEKNFLQRAYAAIVGSLDPAYVPEKDKENVAHLSWMTGASWRFVRGPYGVYYAMDGTDKATACHQVMVLNKHFFNGVSVFKADAVEASISYHDFVRRDMVPLVDLEAVRTELKAVSGPSSGLKPNTCAPQ